MQTFNVKQTLTQLKYDIKVGQETGAMLGVIHEQNGDIVALSEQTFTKREQVIAWVVEKLAEHNPEGPVSMTRKKVYNERVSGRPMFWEITSYNAKGERLHSGQYSAVMQEGYLRGLVQDQFGFPLEAAEEIE